MTARYIIGDCLEVLPALEAESIDALVTDPPAGIAFMGKQWDSNKGGRDQWIEWLTVAMTEVLRVLKPGAHGLVWALPRTSHWTGMALERAGFEIRDQIVHLFGSGYPKGANVSKHIDKAAGAKREVIGVNPNCWTPRDNAVLGGGRGIQATGHDKNITAPATKAAKQWQGYGTGLKPSNEVWWLVRKPFKGTIAANVLEHGTGALNVDGCRIGAGGETFFVPQSTPANRSGIVGKHWQAKGDAARNQAAQRSSIERTERLGRWPPNTLFGHLPACTDTCAEGCAVAELDRQSLKGGMHSAGVARDAIREADVAGLFGMAGGDGHRFGDTDGASRFFPRFRYSAKPSRAEKECGLHGSKTGQRDDTRNPDAPGANNPRNRGGMPRANHHPTVKGLDLMRWLCRLITPPGGTVLDPFMGSGSTGMACVVEGFEFVGIELSSEYVAIAEKRIAACRRGKSEPLGSPKPTRHNDQTGFDFT